MPGFERRCESSRGAIEQGRIFGIGIHKVEFHCVHFLAALSSMEKEDQSECGDHRQSAHSTSDSGVDLAAVWKEGGNPTDEHRSLANAETFRTHLDCPEEIVCLAPTTVA